MIAWKEQRKVLRANGLCPVRDYRRLLRADRGNFLFKGIINLADLKLEVVHYEDQDSFCG